MPRARPSACARRALAVSRVDHGTQPRAVCGAAAADGTVRCGRAQEDTARQPSHVRAGRMWGVASEGGSFERRAPLHGSACMQTSSHAHQARRAHACVWVVWAMAVANERCSATAHTCVCARTHVCVRAQMCVRAHARTNSSASRARTPARRGAQPIQRGGAMARCRAPGVCCSCVRAHTLVCADDCARARARTRVVIGVLGAVVCVEIARAHEA